MKEGLAKFILLLATLWAVVGCGNSSEPYVYTGAPQGPAKVSGANEVMLSVTVPGTVSGAQLRGVTSPGLTVRTVARGETPPAGDYTLPGALCRAYDALGQAVATVVIPQDGTVRFDRLPTDVYRFVVTNHDAAVVLEVIASASDSGPTIVSADTTTTAAVLVTLAAGKGNFDLRTYSHALAADLADLIGLVDAQVANPGDPWITADGKTVVDPAVKHAVEAAVQSLPGKGKVVRTSSPAPPGYGETLRYDRAGANLPLSGETAGPPLGVSPTGQPPQADGVSPPQSAQPIPGAAQPIEAQPAEESEPMVEGDWPPEPLSAEPSAPEPLEPDVSPL